MQNLAETKKWALPSAPEVVDPRLTRPMTADRWEGFTFPLPPMLNENYGGDVTCESITLLDRKTGDGDGLGEGEMEGGAAPDGFTFPFGNLGGGSAKPAEKKPGAGAQGSRSSPHVLSTSGRGYRRRP